jgi:hypothetical protein
MNNKTFIDSSSANRTITVTGTDVAQCSKSPNPPISGVAYSAATHGASVYLKGGTNNNVSTSLTTNWLTIGTGDFTMSCWLFPLTSAASWGNTFLRWGSWNIYRITSSGGISWGNDGFGVASTPANSCPLNTWTHFTASRVSGTLRLFINGSLVSTVADGNNYTVSTGAFGVGMYSTTNNWDGFISGVHIVVGTGLYTSNFTPEYIPTAVANTRLLLRFDNIGMHDSAVKSPLITMGNVARSTTQVKYGSSSLFFPGVSGDYCMVPSGVNSQLVMGTGDFTMEGWVYPTGGIGGFRTICGVGSSTVYVKVYASNTNFWAISINDTTLQVSTTAFTLNTWTHFALVRSASVYYLYVNGVLATSTSSLGTQNYTSGMLIIGAHMNPPTVQMYTGYIDDFRITKYARYTGTFTPPAELPKF